MGTASMAGEPGAEYIATIRDAHSDPRRLEALYQSALGARAAAQFASALGALYQEFPNNLLYAAWHYRLQGAAATTAAGTAGAATVHAVRAGGTNWRLAIPLSVGLALVFWVLSDTTLQFVRGVPYLAVLWAPLAALFVIAFLALASRRGYVQAAVGVVGIAALTAYIMVETPRSDPLGTQSYLALMLLHLPLLAGGAAGVALLGWGSSSADRFGFLTKAIEALGTAGVAVIAGGIFVGLTYAIFSAQDIEIPDVFVRLLLIGGAGLIAVLAVAAVYDPALPPRAQEFRRGFGRIAGVIMRALLPLTVLVLAIFIAIIPFTFGRPYSDRGELIIYNVLLFAVLGLLVGVTPVSQDDVPARWQGWLRAGIVLLAAMVTLVSLYALSAIVYRTVASGALTMNRFVVIGWNVVNIAILVLVLVRQIGAGRAGDGDWIARLHGVFKLGTALYLAWALLLALALPWLF